MTIGQLKKYFFYAEIQSNLRLKYPYNIVPLRGLLLLLRAFHGQTFK